MYISSIIILHHPQDETVVRKHLSSMSCVEFIGSEQGRAVVTLTTDNNRDAENICEQMRVIPGVIDLFFAFGSFVDLNEEFPV